MVLTLRLKLTVQWRQLLVSTADAVDIDVADCSVAPRALYDARDNDIPRSLLENVRVLM